MNDAQARLILERFPEPLHSGRLVALGNRGGFSGARLWRVDTASASWCLRAFPTNGPSRMQLATIHRWLTRAHAAGLAFVPEVACSRDGETCLASAGRVCDLTRWLPGRADFHDQPSLERMQAACTALASLHLSWNPLAQPGPMPAIERRLALLRDWEKLAARGRHATSFPDPIGAWLDRGRRVVTGQIEALRARLLPMRGRNVPLQPCLADIWHAHVLFEGNVVTGLIDHGSARLDHVATDLARLLGSLAGNDPHLRHAGLSAYQRLRPLGLEEEQLVTLLDESGAVLGIVNWLKWLVVEERPFEDRAAVERRLREVVERAEGLV
ncbi:MAG: phosphotransferase [Gemmataceae bacterium]